MLINCSRYANVGSKVLRYSHIVRFQDKQSKCVLTPHQEHPTIVKSLCPSITVADLVGVEDLHGVASTELEPEQFLNLLIVSLVQLLVLDLQLLKVNLMPHLPSLLFLYER